jgi:hypothetical protein
VFVVAFAGIGDLLTTDSFRGFLGRDVDRGSEM